MPKPAPGPSPAFLKRRAREKRQEARREWWERFRTPILGAAAVVLVLCILSYVGNHDKQTVATVCKTISNNELTVVTSDGTFQVRSMWMGIQRGSRGNAELYARIKERNTYAFTHEGFGISPENIVGIQEKTASEAVGTCP